MVEVTVRYADTFPVTQANELTPWLSQHLPELIERHMGLPDAQVGFEVESSGNMHADFFFCIVLWTDVPLEWCRTSTPRTQAIGNEIRAANSKFAQHFFIATQPPKVKISM